MWSDKVILQLIDNLKCKRRSNSISTNATHGFVAPRFVFVCGKAFRDDEETIRDITINRLNKMKLQNEYDGTAKSVLCIVSEDLYTQDLAEDIFSFEKMLAEISDKIIIVVESAGTFCELGAFVMDDECRKKTIVINEDLEEYRKSFVSRGPIKLLEDKDEKNVIRHNGINRLKTSLEFQTRLDEICREELIIPINNNSENIELKGLIYELANIVEIFQPVEKFEIEKIYLKIKEFRNYKMKRRAEHRVGKLGQVLFLMEKMGMLKKKDGLYVLGEQISCYNVMFKIDRREFNKTRIRYLNRMAKYYPERMGSL